MTRIVQIANVSTQCLKEQIKLLFQNIGRVEDIQLFPESETLTSSIGAKVAYIRFTSSEFAQAALQMTNTVFIDRPLICSLVGKSGIPDETIALKYCAPLNPNYTLIPGGATWPNTVINRIVVGNGTSIIETIDPSLVERSLPQYPPLPGTMDPLKAEEVRRTVYVSNISSNVSLDNLNDLFTQIGEIRFIRFAGDENGATKSAYIEFSEQPYIIKALCLNGLYFAGRHLKVNHSTCSIIKPVTTKQIFATTRDKTPKHSSSRSSRRSKSPSSSHKSSKKRTSPHRSSSTHKRSSTKPRSRSPHKHSSSSSSSKKRTHEHDKKRSSSKSKKRSRSRERKRSRSKETKRRRSSSRNVDSVNEYSKHHQKHSTIKNHKSSQNRSRSRERDTVIDKRAKSKEDNASPSRHHHHHQQQHGKRSTSTKGKESHRDSPMEYEHGDNQLLSESNSTNGNNKLKQTTTKEQSGTKSTYGPNPPPPPPPQPPSNKQQNNNNNAVQSSDDSSSSSDSSSDDDEDDDDEEDDK